VWHSLPWQGLEAQTKEQKEEMIKDKKLSTPIEVFAYALRQSNHWFECIWFLANSGAWS